MVKLIYRRFGNRLYLKDDLLSGLTVALALVPEAIAFAFVAGVDPLVGLYAAFIVGLVASVAGGRPGMISGATGAIAVVIVSLVAEHGVAYLFPAVVLMGLLQILVGVLRFGKFIRLVPHSVMLGFVNGLAIIIFIAQLPQFTVSPTEHAAPWMLGIDLYLMTGMVLLTMLIIQFLPSLTKSIPSSLAAILVVTILGLVIESQTGIHIRTVGDLATVGGDFPVFQFFTVSLGWETLEIILPYAVIMAAVGLIESLMTMTLIDELTETRGHGNRECIGQGLANVITGFFGGMGGCAMIGQSMINIRSGGRKRMSGISAALFLLVFILFTSSYIEQIPLAALTGVMFMVVLGTFEWSSIRLLNKIPKSDAFVIILVSTVTVFTDLAIAVFAGIICSALVYAWKSAQHVRVSRDNTDGEESIFSIEGPLFFGSIQSFQQAFDIKSMPDDVILDFRKARVWDHSGVDAINSLTERFSKAGKTLHLRHLSKECILLLDKAKDIIEINIQEDPSYHIAIDNPPKPE